MQRIKGVIDDRIKEEQARQAKVQQTVRPPGARRRPQPQDGSSARPSSRQRDSSSAPIGKSPDPSDFTIGDDESAAISRVATPQPQPEAKSSSQEGQESQDVKQGGDQEESVNSTETATATEHKQTTPEAKPMLQDLPMEVKARLRKLDKLESKYAELFKAYKAAHARVQTIEPFEATLRESTPLTSITDPSALSEYLNQINMKSSMVLDELKRVSEERDKYKQKSEEAEVENRRLEESVQDLKKQLDTQTTASVTQPESTAGGEESAVQEPPAPPAKDTASPMASPKSTPCG